MKIINLMAIAALALCSCTEEAPVVKRMYTASATHTATLYSIDDSDSVAVVRPIVRGEQVSALPGGGRTVKKREYTPVIVNDTTYYILTASLVASRREAVQEKSLFVRTPASVITDRAASAIGTLADKGDEVTVIGYDSLYADGSVDVYKVRKGQTEGYVYAKYLVPDREQALARYMPERYDHLHRAIKNPFGGGVAFDCDFFPRPKPSFAGNTMPEACYSLYLNISPKVLGNIEAYIALAKSTRINTFTIDIKDNECPGFKAEAMRLYSPTNYRHAGDNKELYKRVVKRLHDEGFYVVGRITCFKDSFFVKDHPDAAITEKATGEPFKHNKAYWPSAYDRRVWQFNVELAKEAVRDIGFNEINFDYVRFPDRMNRIENIIDYHNRYNESKVQAIQRFVMYACDEIHTLGAYVSVDVFGEAANPGYTTAYGQYWPALSNVADVMCGMPYPDHFSNGYYGVQQPWNNPYEILNAWGARVLARQAATPTPAKVRTWVQAYRVMRHVDKNGLEYDAEDVEKEIRGLFDAGLTGGYTTWNSASNIKKYQAQADAFRPDYLGEWKRSQGR